MPDGLGSQYLLNTMDADNNYFDGGPDDQDPGACFAFNNRHRQISW
jgi:hypothetical protein